MMRPTTTGKVKRLVLRYNAEEDRIQRMRKRLRLLEERHGRTYERVFDALPAGEGVILPAPGDTSGHLRFGENVVMRSGEQLVRILDVRMRCPGCHVMYGSLDVEHLDNCPYQGRNALPNPNFVNFTFSDQNGLQAVSDEVGDEPAGWLP